MGGEQKIRLGTRGSPLALRQTELVAAMLRDAQPGVQVETRVVRTEGDRVRDRPLSQFGDKGVFVRAIEQALLRDEVDLAVHSLKDVPADVTVPGLVLAAYSPRADARDVLVSRTGSALTGLRAGSLIGTSSARRRVQLMAARPDLAAGDIRGNVDTRVRKVREGQYDAIIIAAAGVIRLGLQDAVSEYLPIDAFTPDAGQGIMVVQGREGDQAVDLARSIDDALSRAAAMAERAVVRSLGADCHSPVGAFADVNRDQLRLTAMAALPDGSVLERTVETGTVADAQAIGERTGRRLLAALAAYTGP